MTSFGYLIALVDVFLRMGRMHDLLPSYFHIPAIVGSAGIVALIMTGRLMIVFTSKLGLYLVFFTFWMMLSIGVSVWPGGSYSFFIEHWVKSLVSFFFVIAFVRTFRRIRALVLMLAAGSACAAVSAFYVGADIAGRSGVATSQGGPNELAFILLFGAPATVWIILNNRTRHWQRVMLFVASAIALPVLAKTGSRAGMLALGILIFYVFLRISTKNRLRLMLAGAIVAPLFFVAVPRVLIVRYATMFTVHEQHDPLDGDVSQTEEVVSSSAAESANSRMGLLKRSIIVTVKNPLLGAGPGMFRVAENEMAVAEGKRRGSWKVTHNMYTQVSSETGIVGLIFFAMILRWIWRAFGRAERADPRLSEFAKELRTLGFALKATLLIYLVTGVALSIAFGPFMPVLAGLAVSVSNLIDGAEAGRRRAADRVNENLSESNDEVQGSPIGVRRSGVEQAVAAS